MAGRPIPRNRLLGSLQEAASWPGAGRNTVVTLAAALVAARADAEGCRYFQDLSEQNPADATAQALAGFFQVRARQDMAAALTKLDKETTTAEELYRQMLAIHPHRVNPGALWLSAQSAKA